MTHRRSLLHWLVPSQSNNQRANLLHPATLAVIIGLYVVFQFLLRQFSATFPQILGYASQIPPQEIIRLTNLERSQRGLASLKLDPQLSNAAAQKAADMFAQNYWAHVSPSGTQPWYFISNTGYEYRYAGENLARDFSHSSAVVAAWIASPSHKENLLSNRYQDIGVAVVDGQLEGRETTLVVQMFGTRLSAQAALGQSSSIAVRAQEEVVESTVPPVQLDNPSPAIHPLASPFDISRNFTLGLLTLFAVVLAVDLIIVHYRGISRWTSKSFAHLMFVVILIVAVTAVVGGRII